MRFHQLDLNLLIYLDALLEEKSVSRAAAKIFLSQSAMSEALSRLRKYFKDPLLISRAGKSTVLSPVAESLVNPVRLVLLQIKTLGREENDFQPQRSKRRFTVMASDYSIDVLLKHVIVKLHQEAPAIQVEIRRMVHSCADEIRKPDIDLLITSGGSMATDLPNEPLWEDTVTCAVWSRNREIRDQIPMNKYLSTGHVCVRLDGHNPPDHERWFVNRFGKTLPVEVVVPLFNEVCQMIQGTNRIATVLLRQAQVYAKAYSLRIVKPPVEFPPLTEFIQWSHHKDRDLTLFWFRKFIRSVAAELR
jgi:DNA-binding transcriptional LysR family regulator